MLSCFPKQLSTNLFEKEMLFANAQNDECRPKVVGRQGQMCAMSPSFLSCNLPDCVEKRVSVESVERDHDHMTERGVTTRVRPKLLHQSLSACEGNAKAWPDWLGGEYPCHATGMTQVSGPGRRKRVEPKLSHSFSHYQLNAIGARVGGEGRGWASLTEIGTCSWQGMSKG